jgi:hypothetical protein
MKFQLGQILCTPGASQAATHRFLDCLQRHVSGDWGVVGAEHKRANDRAVKDGARILSAYPIDPRKPCKGYGENCLWIITEADHRATTLLLPDEY